MKRKALRIMAGLFDFKFLAELIASAPHHMLRRIHTLRCTENTPIYGLYG